MGNIIITNSLIFKAEDALAFIRSLLPQMHKLIAGTSRIATLCVMQQKYCTYTMSRFRAFEAVKPPAEALQWAAHAVIRFWAMRAAKMSSHSQELTRTV